MSESNSNILIKGSGNKTLSSRWRCEREEKEGQFGKDIMEPGFVEGKRCEDRADHESGGIGITVISTDVARQSCCHVETKSLINLLNVPPRRDFSETNTFLLPAIVEGICSAC